MDQKPLLDILMKIPREDKVEHLKALNKYLSENEGWNLKDTIDIELWRHNFSHVNIKDPALNDSVVSLVSSYLYLLEDSHLKIREELLIQKEKKSKSLFSFFYKNRIKEIDRILNLIDSYSLDNLSS